MGNRIVLSNLLFIRLDTGNLIQEWCYNSVNSKKYSLYKQIK